MNTMHEIPYTCYRCEENFVNMNTLRIHISKDHRRSRIFYRLFKENSIPNITNPRRQSLSVPSSAGPSVPFNARSSGQNNFKKTEENKDDNKECEENEVNWKENNTFKKTKENKNNHADWEESCPFNCETGPMMFKHKDEFDLHIEFYHERTTNNF